MKKLFAMLFALSLALTPAGVATFSTAPPTGNACNYIKYDVPVVLPRDMREAAAVYISKLAAAEYSEQIITVTTESMTSSRAVLNMYEKNDGVWRRTQRDLPAVIGSKGLMYDRKQNSYKTPAGEFGFVFAFGAQKNPGVDDGWNYRDITPESYWVLESAHPDYNRWVEGRGSFKSYERLRDFGYQYDYAMVIDFNYENPVKGDGGAIFMHVATDDGKGTAGCVALSREHLLEVMLSLDPAKNPRIIICPKEDLIDFR